MVFPGAFPFYHILEKFFFRPKLAGGGWVGKMNPAVGAEIILQAFQSHFPVSALHTLYDDSVIRATPYFGLRYTAGVRRSYKRPNLQFVHSIVKGLARKLYEFILRQNICSGMHICLGFPT